MTSTVCGAIYRLMVLMVGGTRRKQQVDGTWSPGEGRLLESVMLEGGLGVHSPAQAQSLVHGLPILDRQPFSPSLPISPLHRVPSTVHCRRWGWGWGWAWEEDRTRTGRGERESQDGHGTETRRERGLGDTIHSTRLAMHRLCPLRSASRSRLTVQL